MMAASLRENKKYNAAVSLHGWKDFIRYGHGTAIEQKPYEANSCCMIVHTGGTTGLPKGVMLSNENVNAAFVQASLASLPMKRGMAFLNIMPPFIAYGIAIGIHTVLCSGWVSVLIPAFNPEQFDRLLLKHKPQGIIGVPSYFQKLAASKKMNGADLSFLRVVLVGGDGMKAKTELAINKWLSEHNAQIHISKGYSMTEASAIGTMSFENAICTGSNGIPFPLTTVSAFKEGTDEELPYDTEGEICLSSPTMMLGYYNKQHETDQVIRVHQDGKKWIHSGDLGRVNKDGFVFVEGRLKRLIIRHDGFKVFPTYVESVIQEDQAIDTCCVVGQKDPGHPQGQLPVAFCVKKKDSNISDDTLTMQLAQRCKKELPEYSQPACIYFIDSMPLTLIGKVDYKDLEEMSSSIPSK
jgi:long-chain acyl-CoA synthetase